MNTELVSLENLQGMAKAVAASKLWRSVDTTEKAMALMLLCQAEGLHPMTAVRRYDLIQGQPTLKAEAQLAEFYARGGVVKWIQRSAEVCEAKFSHPKHCPDGVIIKWTLEDAKRAGLAGKDNWRNFPRQMLSARVSAEGVQVVDPGAGLGMLTPEEAIDVRHQLSDQAAEASASLTGEKVEATPDAPVIDEKEYRKLRGELNQGLLKVKSEREFVEFCKGYQVKYGPGVWVEKTRHNERETFHSLAQEHLGRVMADDVMNHPKGTEVGCAEWRAALMRADAKRFHAFERGYARNTILQTQENQDALFQRGRELGVNDYAEDADVNEIHREIGNP